MRKALLTLSILGVAIGLVVVAGAGYLRRDNASRVQRADGLVRNLGTLIVGKSDYKAAEAIATNFGSAPAPYWTSSYPKDNCAARNHLDSCSFIIAMNDSPIEGPVGEIPLSAPPWSSGLVGKCSDKCHKWKRKSLFVCCLVRVVKRAVAGVWSEGKRGPAKI